MIIILYTTLTTSTSYLCLSNLLIEDKDYFNNNASKKDKNLLLFYSHLYVLSILGILLNSFTFYNMILIFITITLIKFSPQYGSKKRFERYIFFMNKKTPSFMKILKRVLEVYFLFFIFMVIISFIVK